MSLNLEKKAVHHALPDRGLVVTRNGREQMYLCHSQTADELLANTLPYALAAEDHGPLREWLLYYARTCA